MKKAAEKNKLSKSMIIMDVKPWDDTTDLGDLEKNVRYEPECQTPNKFCLINWQYQ